MSDKHKWSPDQSPSKPYRSRGWSLIEVDGMTYVVLRPQVELKPGQRTVVLIWQQGNSFFKVLRFFGIGKPAGLILADIIEEQSDPTVALCQDRRVTLRLSTKGRISFSWCSSMFRKSYHATLDHQPLQVFLRLWDDNSMASGLWSLKRTSKTITAAESLTAGLFQATLADFFRGV